MRAKKNKGPLRNFHFLKQADEVLLQLTEQTGRDLVVVLEDLLLQRRQFSPHIEKFLADEANRSGRSRTQIIEAALIATMPPTPNSTQKAAPAVPEEELVSVVVPVDPAQSHGSKPQAKPQTVASEQPHVVKHHSGPKSSRPNHSRRKKTRRARA